MEGQFEVEIKPRDTYKHHVLVRSPGDTIQWTFATRRKNVAFGLGYVYTPTMARQLAGQSLMASASSESLQLARRRSHLLQKTPSEAAMSADFVHEIIRTAQPLVHIAPGPKRPMGGEPAARKDAAPPAAGESPAPNSHVSNLHDALSVVDTDPDEQHTNGHRPDEQCTNGHYPDEKHANAETLPLSLSLSLPLQSLSLSPSSPSPLPLPLPSLASSASSTTSSSLSGTGPADEPEPQAGADGELIMVLPVQKYASSETTVTGSFDAPLAGTYLLLFDNSFSINTAKQLTLTVSVRRQAAQSQSHAFQTDQSLAGPPTTIVHAGWLLKRKRLRMQGFAKRWFKLDSTGLLTYHDDPEGSVKGGMNVRRCVITRVPPRLLLTLDSGTDLFHLKALTDTDYREWTDRIAAVNQQLTMAANQSAAMAIPPGSPSAAADLFPSSAAAPGIGPAPPALLERARDRRADARRAMDELRAVGEQDDGTNTEMRRHLALLEHTFACLDAFYEALLSISLAPGPAEQHPQALSMAHPSPTIGGRLAAAVGGGLKQPLSRLPDEEIDDVFYDAQGYEELVISDATEAEVYEEETVGLGAEITTRPSSAAPSLAPSSLSELDAEAEQIEQQLAAGAQVVRLALPSPAHPINVSFSELLYRQSMSRTAPASASSGPPMSTLPVVLNEPLSALQRQCEDLEYSELLDAAARSSDPVERLCLLAAFAVSAYASGAHRVAYKPFTPMLGETFEWTDRARAFRFLAEKTEHQPDTVLACHAESTGGAGWRYWQELRMRTKFSFVKTPELNPGGFTHVELPDLEGRRGVVRYRWNKVTTFFRNILSPAAFLDNCGEMIIRCLPGDGDGDGADPEDSPDARLYVRLDFAKSSSGGSGFFGLGTAARTGRNDVTGAVIRVDRAGRRSAVCRLAGRWDEYMAAGERLLWRANPPPASSRDYYGFGLLTLQLNCPPTPEAAVLLPATDSRFRPDQRLVENGDIEAADAEKARLEWQQRLERQARAERGESWQPRWFVRRRSLLAPLSPEEEAAAEQANEEYVYAGAYWPAKDSGSFKGIPSPW